MKRLLRLPSLLRLTLVFLIALVFQNCTEQKIKETTDETLNVTAYLRANKDYSMFLEILDITNYASFMNTYGTYTVFLPTNEAVKQYLTDIGASSLSEVPLVDLQNIAKLHILDQKVNTTAFTDGKIATPSLYGQFLITGAVNKNGVSSVTVNKSASIITSNLEVGNGVIHVIDKVLRVADKTVAQTIEANPKLSLFTEVLKATGWYDKLNKPLSNSSDISSYLTVLAQTNDVFENTTWKNPSGVTIKLNTLDNLKQRYSHLNNPLDPKDSLNLFVSYRVLPRLQYLADIAVSPALETKAPLEVITSRLEGDVILLNQEVFNGVLEKGAAIVKDLSDVTCSNGVLHYVDYNFSMKKRNPAPVYFDFTDQPEFRKLTSIFRTSIGGFKTLAKSEFSDITWDGTGSISYSKAATGTAISTGIAACWHTDVLEINNMRDGLIQNIVFKTPVIIKGKYKIWVSWRQQGTKLGFLKVFFDGVELPRQINLMEAGNTTLDERVLESQGYKRYISPFTNRVNCRLVGTVDVTTTARHTISFQSQSSFSAATWLDIAEFRPVEMDQLWPKFAAGKDNLVTQ